jgi:hypothetical protein
LKHNGNTVDLEFPKQSKNDTEKIAPTQNMAPARETEWKGKATDRK